MELTRFLGLRHEATSVAGASLNQSPIGLDLSEVIDDVKGFVNRCG